MRIVISGSRFWNPSSLQWFGERVYENLPNNLFGDYEFVHGKCPTGADYHMHRLIEKYNLKYKTFPADWDKHDKAAGMMRNKEMADYGDHLVAFWDMKSPGTGDMIEQMKSAKKTYSIVDISEKRFS